MMNYYLVMINARSGGQDGPQLLDKFREVVERGELNGELVSLTDPRPGGGGVIGPGPALRKHRTRNKLRIIGKLLLLDITRVSHFDLSVSHFDLSVSHFKFLVSFPFFLFPSHFLWSRFLFLLANILVPYGMLENNYGSRSANSVPLSVLPAVCCSRFISFKEIGGRKSGNNFKFLI